MARTPEEYRKDPIHKTDFSKSIVQLIEDMRNQFCGIRNTLYDVVHGYPQHTHELEHVEGLINCGVITLYNSIQNITKNEVEWADREHGKSRQFNSRGVGLDVCPGCFVCGSEIRADGANHYLNNIAAYVRCKSDGEEVVGWFERGARLDFRDYEPDYIQLKVGACDLHIANLQHLHDLTTRAYGRIRKHMIVDAIAFQKEAPSEKDRIPEVG